MDNVNTDINTQAHLLKTACLFYLIVFPLPQLSFVCPAWLGGWQSWLPASGNSTNNLIDV